MTTQRIIAGDCIAGLRTLPDASVHCCVTSPPYWGLRDYGHAGQIGLEETPEAYVARIVEVFREVRRVLRDDGTLWLNLGDSYLSGRGSQKNLAGIPWRVALAMQGDGWILRQDIVWHKLDSMPENVQDRCTKTHEYVFMLTKKTRYFYDAHAAREPSAQPGRVRMDRSGGNKYQAGVKHSDGSVYTGGATRNRRSVWSMPTATFKGAHFATMPPSLVEPCILAGTSEGGCCSNCGSPLSRVVEKGVPCPEPAHRQPAKRLVAHQAGNVGEGNMGFRASKLSGQEMSRWKADHPDKTVGWEPACDCNAGVVPCTALDPFAGSGTTLAVAATLGRNAIGCELNPDYIKLAEKRIADARAKAPLFS